MSHTNAALRLTPACGVLLVVASFGLSGCGPGKYAVVPAKGKVVCNGLPVTMGSVSFSPIGEEGDQEPGKPASGTIDVDGTFVLTTRKPFDGAIIGKHRVRYFAPEGDEEEESAEGSADDEESAEVARQRAERAQKREVLLRSLCVQTEEIVVEVLPDGENDFTIELSSGAKARSDAEATSDD